MKISGSVEDDQSVSTWYFHDFVTSLKLFSNLEPFPSRCRLRSQIARSFVLDTSMHLTFEDTKNFFNEKAVDRRKLTNSSIDVTRAILESNRTPLLLIATENLTLRF